MGKSKDLATGAAYVDASGDTMTGALTVDGAIESLKDEYGEGGHLTLRAHPTYNYRFNVDNYQDSLRVVKEDDATGANGAVYMTVDASGRVTMPYQPAFRATRSAGTATFTGSSVLIYDVVRSNQGSCYNASTGTFTAPVSGIYAFSFSYYTDAGVDEMVDLVLNGGTIIGRTEMRYNAGNNSVVATGMIMYPLAANDYVQVKNANTGNAELIGGVDYMYFNGYLIG